MTGLTRCQAAKAISGVLGGEVVHEGGTYDKYTVKDIKSRDWSIVYDGSINCYNANGDRASKSYSVEMNSPVLEYGDIPLLQEVVRALRKAGGVTGPRYCAGTHIHISADDYTPQQIRNLVNILQVRRTFCGTLCRFLLLVNPTVTRWISSSSRKLTEKSLKIWKK